MTDNAGRPPVQVVLDVDTGVDDALGILFAVRHRDIDVLAITCVTGNVHVDQVVTNTLTVLDVAGASDIPVARGAERPLVAAADLSRSVHGVDGLADLGLTRPVREPVATAAADLLGTTISDATRPVTVVSLAPPTNVAVLLRRHPGLIGHVERVVVIGNVASAAAGFNLRADPEATSVLFRCGVPITMYGPEVFHDVLLSREEAEALAGRVDSGTRLAGRLALHQVGRFGGEAATIGDAGAVVSLVAPGGLVTTPVATGDHCPVEVAMSVDGPVYSRLFIDTVGRR